MRVVSAVAAAAVCCLVSSGAGAQQNLDEPKIKPILGQPYEEPNTERIEDRNDDEFDGDKRWHRASGLTALFTFLTPETSDISVGVGPVYRPDYFGSDDYHFDADPVAYVRFKNFMFFDDDGADIALFGFSGFKFGPTMRIVGERKESENPALMGLGDVGLTFEFGGFASAELWDRFKFRFKTRHGIKTGHRGTIVDATATALLFRWGPVSTSISGQAAWIGNRYADAYFSVTPDQSLASGLPVFDAKAGFRDVGGSFNAYINVLDHWSVNPYVSYRYILDGIASTPIIDTYGSRDQMAVGFHLVREFSFGRGKRTSL
jgi:outer membrane protein